MSAPEQNPRPAPVITTDRIDSSVSHFISELDIPSTNSWFTALYRSGRFSVIVATPFFTLNNTGFSMIC